MFVYKIEYKQILYLFSNAWNEFCNDQPTDESSSCLFVSFSSIHQIAIFYKASLWIFLCFNICVKNLLCVSVKADLHLMGRSKRTSDPFPLSSPNFPTVNKNIKKSNKNNNKNYHGKLSELHFNVSLWFFF